MEERKEKDRRFRIKIEELNEQDNPMTDRGLERICDGFFLTCCDRLGSNSYAGGLLSPALAMKAILNSYDDNTSALECVADALKRSKHGPYCDCEVSEE